MCTAFSKELPKNLLRFCIFFSSFYRCSAVKKHLPPLKFSLFIYFCYCIFVTFNVLDHKLISILDKGLSRAGLWGQQQTEPTHPGAILGRYPNHLNTFQYKMPPPFFFKMMTLFIKAEKQQQKQLSKPIWSYVGKK